jgi:hypothetical protein
LSQGNIDMTLRNASLAWLLCAAFAFNATAQDATVLTLTREHVGNDCVVGPVTSERDVLAWAVERPWKGNNTVWGRLLPGTYPASAIYRKGTGIALTVSDLPDQPASVLVLGARTENGAGRIAIGLEVVGNCQVESRRGYPAVAERLAQRMFGTKNPADGQSTKLRLRVVDR